MSSLSAANVDLVRVAGAECFLSLVYYHRLQLFSLLPLGLVLAAASNYAVTR